MLQRQRALVRRAVGVVTMGVVLQAGGCVSDPSGLIQQFVGTVANTVLAGFVCDNLGAPVNACNPALGGFF